MKIRTEDLTWQEIDEEIIVLDLRASAYLKLNGSGALLWHGLQDGEDPAGLVGRLTAQYEIDEATAQRDVDRFLASLREAKLLVE